MSVAESDPTGPRGAVPDNSQLPVKPADPTSPREVENPGDPGPTVLVPPSQDDPRKNPKLPPTGNPAPGI
jgi:hypothetical protein